MITDSDMRFEVMCEGTQRGMPRKRALFGPGCSESESPVSDVEEAQTGWPISRRELGLREWVLQVALLQKEDFRSESGYGCPGTLIPPQQSGWAGFMSTSVPMFAGTTSWDQYRQVFEAIVSSNGWDDVTAALQLLAHLEGDTLNVALLVPAPRRVLSAGVVGGSGGCADRAFPVGKCKI